MTVHTRIAKASFVLIAASVLGHALSLAKEVVVANYFGITRSMDAYYTALTIPNLVNNIFLSPFTIIFIPIYIQFRLSDKEVADTLASILANAIIAVLLAASLLMILLSRPIISLSFPGLGAETSALTVGLFNVICVSLAFSGLAVILTGLINACESFLWPALSQMLITLSTIFFVVFFARKWGAYVFAWGLLAGALLQCVFLYPVAARCGYRHRWKLRLSDPRLRSTRNSFLFFVLLTLVSGLAPFINRTMASWLPVGSIAALGLADKLFQVPLIIFSGSVVTATYPFFSAQIAENRIDEMKNTLATSLKMCGFLFIPMTMILIVLAKPLIELLFQRGAFDAQATALTSVVFACCSLQLLSIYAMALMQRILFILQELPGILKLSALSVVMTIALNYLFIKTITPPAAGIAMSASAVCLLISLLYFALLKRKVGALHGLSIVKSLGKTAAFSLVSAGAVFLLFRELDGAFAYSKWTRGANLIGSGACGVLVFAALTLLFKTDESKKVRDLARMQLEKLFGAAA